jgi:aspartyl-tRNA(Asn)/glutamyl-tRNA(Gln) amidotransferase subunit C
VGLNVSVTEKDVRHVAALARIALPPERVAALVSELDGILRHMHVLARVDTGDVDPVLGVGAGGMPLRTDEGEPYPLAHPQASFAPEMRDGFFLVPRLATHADAGASAHALGAEAPA